MTKNNFIKLINKNRKKIGPIFNFDLNQNQAYIFDLSETNKNLDKIDFNDIDNFTAYIFNSLEKNNASFGIGKYNENRIIYRHSKIFKNEKNPRTIHLGLDIWLKAGVPIFSPLDARVHSFKNNESIGDYGGTIILEHELDGKIFHTLYGHLSLTSLKGLRIGQLIDKGEKIGTIGDITENGQWPPHLHFQIILDIMEKFGDYPGVCSLIDRKKFLEICPDPNLFLDISILQ